ncbi:endo-1,3(4)-beta-glucanase [Lipomyces arxii]|uniref:endo-1,3(4)-beta-glucanase n=1 Tax=Lipomyces arxii TaxID=56418 RepID=UPI0034CDA1E4
MTFPDSFYPTWLLLVVLSLAQLTLAVPVTTALVETTVESSQTVQFLRSTPSPVKSAGYVVSSLEVDGRSNALPFPTASSIVLNPSPPTFPTNLPAPVDFEALHGIDAASATINLFRPVATSAPSTRFPRLRQHPAQPKGLSANYISGQTIPTNNFYTNLLLGGQDNGVYVYPYMVWWNQGVGGDWGLAVSHTSRSQFTYGPDPNANPVQYFISPIGIRSLSFSAAEFDSGMTLQLDHPSQFSINATFAASVSKYGRGHTLNVPLVQGVGFVTGIYKNLQPKLTSLVGINALMERKAPMPNMRKYVAKLNDNNYWVIYVSMRSGDFQLSLENANTILASRRVSNAYIQVAKMVSNSESAYDKHAGKYSVGASVSGTSWYSAATYTINYWTRNDNVAKQLLLFALPHHVTSFTSALKRRSLGFSLDSLSKGKMYAYSSNQLVMSETIPRSIQFAPWTSIPGNSATYTKAALGQITKAAVSEVVQDMNAQTNTDSMYFAGKALDKFAYICYVSHDILRNTAITNYCLKNLKSAFALFAQNKQIHPLYYDQTYKGLISSAAITTGDPNSDFGNSYYNDHHFHYGYHIHAAAIIGYIDNALGGTWVRDNKDYVNSLVRDINNPSTEDSYFPLSRSFSWFHGHSWAKGVFESSDGKDQESSSEDYHHAYAIKLWGQVVKDQSMEMRGALMMAVMKRSMNSYMLMNSTNTIQPKNFIGNKVTGILFENKVDHTTYFGTEPQYIQGIHMLPITPVSSYMRSPTFVREEWNSIVGAFAPSLTDGWKGVMYANLALTDPRAAYRFFTGSSFNSNFLDGGASLTWYLAYIAGVGGAAA